MNLFTNLGRALRWLREEREMRQYQVAEAASITKAMLSAYETGKQRPSLDTLEKILVALDCDLEALHEALEVIDTGTRHARARPTERYRRRRLRSTALDTAAIDVYELLGLGSRLAPGEEEALEEMLQGFHKLVRHLHHATRDAFASEITPPGAHSNDREREPDQQP